VNVGESRAQPVSFDRDFSVPDRAARKETSLDLIINNNMERRCVP